MRADSIHKYRNPPVKKKISPSIFVNSQKHRNRKVQRISCEERVRKQMAPEIEKELRQKQRKERIKDTTISVMLSVLLVFALISLFYWAAVK